MNKVILMGRLIKDPEIRYGQGENATAVARYTLAVERKIKNDDQNADFIRCVAFGKLAEFAEKWLKQGTKICITGRIQTGSYTDKDGRKVYTTDIIVEENEFAESKKASLDGSKPQADGDGFTNIPDGADELPLNNKKGAAACGYRQDFKKRLSLRESRNNLAADIMRYAVANVVLAN